MDALVARHAALRTKMLPDGTQQVMAKVTPFALAVRAPPAGLDGAAEARASRVSRTGSWCLRVVKTDVRGFVTIESVLKSHVTCASTLERSIVPKSVP